VIVQKFGLIGVSPPMNAEDLDLKIEAIGKKQTWYEDNGKTKLLE